jgi:3-oxoadipate enol-lactonase
MRTALGTVFCLFALSPLWAQTQTVSQTPQAPGPGSFVEVESGKLYYEECGSGLQTVVLLHDGGAHSAVWDDVWPAFCKQFHTIRYDRRGYGRSPEATTWYYEVEDLATLLRHLKVARAAVVGSSHGGSVSMDFSLQYPQMVQQLVLVGAVVSGLPYSDHFLNRGI